MFTFGLLIVAILLLASVANRRERDRRWNYRPYRLCTNCYTVAQPLLRGNNEMYCPACQRIDPAPLESPVSGEYFRARGIPPPQQPVPPTPTQKQLRLRMGLSAALVVGLLSFGIFLDHEVEGGSSPSPAVAAPVVAKTETHTVDEFAALTSACGQPVSRRDKDASAYGGRNGRELDVRYRRVDFLFLRNTQDSPAWTLTGAFPHSSDDTIDHEHALQLMPCLRKVHFQVALRDGE